VTDEPTLSVWQAISTKRAVRAKPKSFCIGSSK